MNQQVSNDEASLEQVKTSVKATSNGLKSLQENFVLKMKEIELDLARHAEEAEGRDGLILQLN